MATLGYTPALLRRRLSARAASRRGCTAWKAPSGTSAACRAEVLLDNARAAGRPSTTRRRARCASTTASSRSAAYWGFAPRAVRAVSRADQGQGRARGRLRQAQRHRRAAASRAGRRCEAHLEQWMRDGRRRARPRHHRRAAAASASSDAKRPRCGRCTAKPPFQQDARADAARCTPTAASRWTPTATACRGG
ncbi:MAG: hypothetical protein MZW92_36185 [Comamonadaceae bacterium]|nr:hypothetical protein [Comamonadaceae bacterium]